jgi:P-type conjugative transfer ATPase TrbB
MVKHDNHASHKDGDEHQETEQQRRLNEKLRRELGPAIIEALDDPNVFEVQLNPDGRVWADRFGQGKVHIATMSKTKAMNVLGTVAGMLGLEATASTPIVEGELPLDGSRFAGSIPPIVERAQFAIRKKALKIFTYQDYLDQGTMTPAQWEAIDNHIKQKHNILVVGGTGSGKTTLCNALLQRIVETDPTTRIVIIEDTRELQCAAVHLVSYKVSDTIDMTRLLKLTLRQTPDRIVVGEVRDKAALDLLKSWNTGHGGGVGTLHANSAEEGLVRLEQLIAESGSTALPAVIASAVNCVISIQKADGGRKIQQICTVKGGSSDGYDLEFH